MKLVIKPFILLSFIVLPFGAGQAQEAPTVVVRPVEMREMSTRKEFIGRIEAAERVEIRARITGTLSAPKFKDGQRVEPGQVLYEIDPAQFQADVDAKKAQLAIARADAVNAELNFERAQELLKSNAGTKVTFDQRKAELAKAEASVQVAAAALENATITLGYTRITAPIAGRIGRTAITEGNIVSPSSGVLATIVKDDTMRAVFSVSQREVLEYRRADFTRKPKVRLRLADNSFYAVEGVIDYIDNAVDPRTDGQILRATFGNPDGILVHDQTVRIAIEQPAEAPQMIVPQQALAADQSGTFVLIVDAEQKVAQRHVKLGPGRDGVVAVTEGLKAEDRIIVQGMQRVRPGMKVNVQLVPAGK